MACLDDRFLLSKACSIDTKADAVDNDEFYCLFQALLGLDLVKVSLHEIDNAKDVTDGKRLAFESLELSRFI